MIRLYPGLPDDAFIRGNAPMTKQEIRLYVLTKARPQPADTVIDVGAGTGSIAVEAARLAPEGRVFAVERDPEALGLIAANADRFGAANLTVVSGEAPEALAGLPPADVIVVGGSGGRLEALLDAAAGGLKPGGRLVVTAVTAETVTRALAFLTALGGWSVDAVSIQATRLRPAGKSHLFQAQNPVVIVTGIKGGQP